MPVAGDKSSGNMATHPVTGSARSHMASKNQASRKGQTDHKRPAGKARPKNGRVRGSQRPENGDGRTSENLLERGDLFFFYRPDVDETTPGGLLDVRRFHVVLRPEGKETLRLITIGRKK